MSARPCSARVVFALSVTLTLTACKTQDSATAEPTIEPTPSESESKPPANDGVAGPPTTKELPVELVAELRLAGSGTEGRLLSIGSGFVAAVESSESGAPSYLWFLAVRCADTRHCEVLTELCEGSISRDVDTYVLEFRPTDAGNAEVCAGYSGTYELP